MTTTTSPAAATTATFGQYTVVMFPDREVAFIIEAPSHDGELQRDRGFILDMMDVTAHLSERGFRPPNYGEDWRLTTHQPGIGEVPWPVRVVYPSS